MKINVHWHQAHKMPKNATLEDKIKWHAGHARHCRCRDSAPHLLKLKKTPVEKRLCIIIISFDPLPAYARDQNNLEKPSAL